MTELSEAEFLSQRVLPWIRERHPTASIETERWIHRTGAFCDVWVDLGTHELAIEVGNNPSSVRAEAAQAMEYAAESGSAVPVVVVPTDHAEPSVVEVFEERGVLVWFVPTERT
ncbi:hypothetical protein [Halolamina sp. C58]|uniref:hypothetical protein n=1 Tax=Halolamina sp. C58 TaxID=3421640 RepID=UPI003EB9A3DD